MPALPQPESEPRPGSEAPADRGGLADGASLFYRDPHFQEREAERYQAARDEAQERAARHEANLAHLAHEASRAQLVQDEAHLAQQALHFAQEARVQQLRQEQEAAERVEAADRAQWDEADARDLLARVQAERALAAEHPEAAERAQRAEQEARDLLARVDAEQLAARPQLAYPRPRDDPMDAPRAREAPMQPAGLWLAPVPRSWGAQGHAASSGEGEEAKL